MKNEESGREFSTVWKMFFHGVEKPGRFFHTMEKYFWIFPQYGKLLSEFSTVWKKYFHGMEKSVSRRG